MSDGPGEPGRSHMPNLTFLHPAALWLTAGAALPVIIHLLSRQKPVVIPFPAVRFIRRSRRRSLRRTRLKHLLLLLMRMVLIALFALLIARPVLRADAAAAGEAGQDGTPAVALILDDSLSMTCRSGDATWFDVARSRAVEIAQSLTPGTAAAVLTTTQPHGKLERETDTVLGRIRGLRAGTRASSCWTALENAAQTLRETGAPRCDVVLLTDMTHGAWLGRERRTVALGDGVNVYVADCASDGIGTGAISEVRHSGEPPVAGAELGLEATVSASGSAQERSVQFMFDGELVDRRTVALQAGEETTVSFRAPLPTSGHHWGAVSFLNPDPLPLDDARTFTVEVDEDVSVLCVEDEPARQQGSVSQFFRLALDPWGEARRDMFRVHRISPAGLETQPLAPMDIVVLAGAGGMTPELWRRLEGYVAGGGGLLVFAGPETGRAYADEAARRVLPAAMGETVSAPEDAPLRARIVYTDHPLIESLAEAGADLGEARFRQCRRLEPADSAEELLSFGAGLPALAVRETGGRAAVFAGTADERWGDLASTPAFVPFCHETLLYLARRSAGTIQSYTVGARVPIRFEPSRWPTVVHVTPPKSAGPERLMPGTTPGRVTYWKTDLPGYYRLAFEQHGESWQGGFAVNTPPVESRLDRVPFEEVADRIEAGSVELLEEAKLGNGALGAHGGGGEITAYLALLANRFYRSERT